MDALATVAARIAAARTVAILTGAGISAASGVPTFRGADGLWKNFRAEALATPAAFARDPRLVWEWYDWRRGLIANVQPNAAHAVLASWSRQNSRVKLVTQNVDGLLERAGAADVVRLHGSIWHLKCWSPCAAGNAEWADHRAPLPSLPPSCPHCGRLARPAVTWFGEPLPSRALETAMDAAADAEVFLSIGTSAVVYPAAGLIPLARRAGALIVEINADETEASAAVDVVLRGNAEAILPALDDAIRQSR